MVHLPDRVPHQETLPDSDPEDLTSDFRDVAVILVRQFEAFIITAYLKCGGHKFEDRFVKHMMEHLIALVWADSSFQWRIQNFCDAIDTGNTDNRWKQTVETISFGLPKRGTEVVSERDLYGIIFTHVLAVVDEARCGASRASDRMYQHLLSKANQPFEHATVDQILLRYNIPRYLSEPDPDPDPVSVTNGPPMEPTMPTTPAGSNYTQNTPGTSVPPQSLGDQNQANGLETGNARFDGGYFNFSTLQTELMRIKNSFPWIQGALKTLASNSRPMMEHIEIASRDMQKAINRTEWVYQTVKKRSDEATTPF